MGNHDIANSFNGSEKVTFEFIKTLHNLLYENNNIKLVYADEDVYMQRIMEYCYGLIIPRDEEITSDTLLTVDMSSVFNNYMFSDDLAKTILEMVFTEKMFLYINAMALDKASIINDCELKDIYNTVIDQGLVSGKDISLFVNIDTTINMLADYIITSMNLIKENTNETSLMFIGWLFPSRLALIKYNTKEHTDENC